MIKTTFDLGVTVLNVANNCDPVIPEKFPNIHIKCDNDSP